MKKLHYSWIIILTGGLLMFGMSAQQMSHGVFLPQVADSLNIGMGTVSLAFSTTTIMMMFLAPLAAKMFEKYSPKLLSCGAAAIQGLSLVILSFSKSFAAICVACILESFGISCFLGVLSSTIIKRWFKDRGQFAYNIILYISMLGGVVFTPIASAIIEATSWRVAYRVLAGFIFFLEIPTVMIFFKDSPEQIGIKPYEDPEGTVRKVVPSVPVINADVTAKSSWKNKMFYLVCLYHTAIGYAATMQNHLVKHLTSIGFSSTLGASTVTAGLVGGLLGRVILGFATDKFGIKATNFVYCTVGVFSALVLCNCYHATATLVIAMGFFFGLAVRSSNVLSSMLKYRVFGASQDFTRIVANTTIVTSIFTATSGTVFGYIFDWSGSYNIGFVVVVVMFVISIVVANILLKSEKRVIK